MADTNTNEEQQLDAAGGAHHPTDLFTIHIVNDDDAKNPPTAPSDGAPTNEIIFGPEVEGQADMHLLDLLAVLQDGTKKNKEAEGTHPLPWVPSRGYLRAVTNVFGVHLPSPPPMPVVTPKVNVEGLIDWDEIPEDVEQQVAEFLNNEIEVQYKRAVQAREDKYFKRVMEKFLPGLASGLHILAPLLSPPENTDGDTQQAETNEFFADPNIRNLFNMTMKETFHTRRKVSLMASIVGQES